jgi:hypothetical protein
MDADLPSRAAARISVSRVAGTHPFEVPGIDESAAFAQLAAPSLARRPGER